MKPIVPRWKLSSVGRGQSGALPPYATAELGKCSSASLIHRKAAQILSHVHSYICRVHAECVDPTTLFHIFIFTPDEARFRDAQQGFMLSMVRS